MINRLIGVALCAVVVGACQDASIDSRSPAGPTAASTQTATIGSGSPASPVAASLPDVVSGARPWKASLMWTVAGIEWAGQPGVDKSYFDGRCSKLSDYVISGAFQGEATHAGRVTGTTEHCSQLTWGPQGPTGAAYTDGQGSVVAANGSTLVLRYGDGTHGVDIETGENWFRDTWTFNGGTGLFAGATGRGQEEGRFKDFDTLLAGAAAPMWMKGTITYDPARGSGY